MKTRIYLKRHDLQSDLTKLEDELHRLENEAKRNQCLKIKYLSKMRSLINVWYEVMENEIPEAKWVAHNFVHNSIKFTYLYLNLDVLCFLKYYIIEFLKKGELTYIPIVINRQSDVDWLYFKYYGEKVGWELDKSHAEAYIDKLKHLNKSFEEDALKDEQKKIENSIFRQAIESNKQRIRNLQKILNGELNEATRRTS